MNPIKALWLRILRKFSKRNEVYYINGPELLPAPYTPEREAEMIEALEAGDPDARVALIEHNLRLVVYIAKKFESTGTGIEDLISIGTIGLCKAVGTFRSDKNIKLATYASRCIENEILMHLRKQSGKGGEVSLDEPLNVDFDGNATDDIRFNPNDSAFAIEGITSPDGRVFGKMGHSERIGSGLYKNVEGKYDMKLFESAVKYFS